MIGTEPQKTPVPPLRYGGLPEYGRDCDMRMTVLGSLEERHMGYGTAFMDGEKAGHAAAFAGALIARLTDASAAAGPAQP